MYNRLHLYLLYVLLYIISHVKTEVSNNIVYKMYTLYVTNLYICNVYIYITLCI